MQIFYQNLSANPVNDTTYLNSLASLTDASLAEMAEMVANLPNQFGWGVWDM